MENITSKKIDATVLLFQLFYEFYDYYLSINIYLTIKINNKIYSVENGSLCRT